ncbi:hypothetical protein V6N13_097618 [Hibiscus sabdariffa]|uniref:Uncharacterized protein n=1 Tax=Hibiscus sabdariffa TaxID=183260 RepID=A0ABR2BUL8_9ROSI
MATSTGAFPAFPVELIVDLVPQAPTHITDVAPQERKDAPPAKRTTATSKKKGKKIVASFNTSPSVVDDFPDIVASTRSAKKKASPIHLPSDEDDDVASSARSISPLSPSPTHATASGPTSGLAKTRTKRIVGCVIKPIFINQMPTDIFFRLEFDDSPEPTNAPASPTSLATKHPEPIPTPMTSFKKATRKPSPSHP